MTDLLRAATLSRLVDIHAEADEAHERSLALAARALELDKVLEREAAMHGFSFEEIAAARHPASF